MDCGYISLFGEQAELQWHNQYPGRWTKADDTVMKQVSVLSNRSSARVACRCPACGAVVIEAGEAVHPEWSDSDADLFDPGSDLRDR
jgi:hypothetical protein